MILYPKNETNITSNGITFTINNSFNHKSEISDMTNRLDLILGMIVKDFFKNTKIAFDSISKLLDKNKTFLKIKIPVCYEHYNSFNDVITDNVDDEYSDFFGELELNIKNTNYTLSKPEWIKNDFTVELESNNKDIKCVSCDDMNCDHVLILQRSLGDMK